MSETQEMSESVIVDVTKGAFEEAKKDFWGIREAARGYDIRKTVPTKDNIIALVQAGFNYYKARSVELASHHRDVTEEHENEVKQIEYERALAYVRGERNNNQSYLSVLHKMGEEENQWVKREFSRKAGFFSSRLEKDSRSVAHDQLPIALDKMREVLQSAQGFVPDIVKNS